MECSLPFLSSGPVKRLPHNNTCCKLSQMLYLRSWMGEHYPNKNDLDKAMHAQADRSVVSRQMTNVVQESAADGVHVAASVDAYSKLA